MVVGVSVLLGGFAFLDERMGWGLTERSRGDQPEASPQPPEEANTDAQNYGPATPEHPRLGRWMPHPDDPPPAVAEEPEAEAQGPSPPPVEAQGVPRPDVYEQIRRLAGLRDEGLITAEEFETKKRELLDRL